MYHSGDSGLIPEMNNLRKIDVALLTVREPYMMSPKEVVQAVKIIKPKILIPIHWIDEEKSDIEYIIKNVAKSTRAIIPKRK